MKKMSNIKNPSTLKQRFKDLIETLRSKTTFDGKPHLSLQDILQPIQQDLDRPDNTLPTTHNQDKFNNENKQESDHLDPMSLNPSLLIQELKDFDKDLKIKKDSQIEILDKDETEQQIQINNLSPLRKQNSLVPESAMKCPQNEGRVGQIRHQNTSVNLNLNLRMEKQNNQIRYSKMDTRRQSFAKHLPPQTKRLRVPIKQLDDLQVIKYWNKHPKLNQTSTSTQTYRYFQTMMDTLSIDISDPIIQKFNNCVYFGVNKCPYIYQGIIYYFSSKLYYGEFMNGIKHGHGVEIHFITNIKYAGIFNGGSKNGYFFVQKDKENYQGTLHYGLYHGNGKLMTEDYVYTGSFQNGKKDGYGEEIHPKTGLKIQGYFRQGEYQNLNETPKKKEPQEQQQLSKFDRKTLKKSESYDMKVELTSKIMSRQRSARIQPVQQPQMSRIKDRQSQPNQIQFQQDSKSLFDLLQKKERASKYDFYVDKIAKRMPKIHIEGLSHNEMGINPEDVIVNRRERQDGQNSTVKSKFSFRHKPTNLSIPKQGNQSNDKPLFRRKLVQTPIARI